jgi:hypothetical protein
VNISIVTRRAIGVIAGLCLSLALYAATTGSISLSGTQPAILSITATANAAATSLAVNTNVTNLLVGTVVEQSNDSAGYTVTLTSANAATAQGTSAFLKSTKAGNADTLPYTLQYGTTTPVTVVFLSTGVATVSNVTAKTGSAGTSNNLTLSFSGLTANLAQDVYVDTLTFTIIAK